MMARSARTAARLTSGPATWNMGPTEAGSLIPGHQRWQDSWL
jgi:hypothetical protein